MSKTLHVATLNLITLDFKSSKNIFYKYVRRFLSFLISLRTLSRSLILFCHSFSWLDLDCLLNSLADVFVIFLRCPNNINLPKISYRFFQCSVTLRCFPTVGLTFSFLSAFLVTRSLNFFPASQIHYFVLVHRIIDHSATPLLIAFSSWIWIRHFFHTISALLFSDILP